MTIHPRYKRHLRQTLAFGIIWLVFGVVYSFLERGLLGNLTIYPATQNVYDFKNAFIFQGLGSFLTGLLQGSVEVFWLKKRLMYKPFRVKIVLKSLFYLFFSILFLMTLSLLANARLLDIDVFEPKNINAVLLFITDFVFWSIILYAGVIINVALFYSEMGTYLGNGVLYNYSFGKYHRPKQETRIFMFLDMKSSTTIAEKIGHVKYFDLLNTYYADMTDAILETSGQIYQYVGDEIVVSWSKKEGIYDNNCIQCFSKITEAITKNREKYLESFGIVPEYKAGYHIGEVTTGEIGIIKKDIIHTGDVLNTTARIQGQCNVHNSKALISGDLLTELQKEDPISFTRIGELVLRGKTEAIQLYSVLF